MKHLRKLMDSFSLFLFSYSQITDIQGKYCSLFQNSVNDVIVEFPCLLLVRTNPNIHFLKKDWNRLANTYQRPGYMSGLVRSHGRHGNSAYWGWSCFRRKWSQRPVPPSFVEKLLHSNYSTVLLSKGPNQWDGQRAGMVSYVSEYLINYEKNLSNKSAIIQWMSCVYSPLL